MEFISTINQILSLLTIGSQIIIVLLVVSFLFVRKRGGNAILSFFSKNAIAFAFSIALGATIISLFYSDIMGYEPCKLCWFQRIFMYPQVILLGIALWKKDRNIADYSIALAVMGAVLAGFQYYLQVSGSSLLPCSIVDYSASCAQRFVIQFGYITIPMMSLTAFVLIILLIAVQKFYNKTS